jgi:TetR/AcrR family transcriptional repressor of bet genes
MIMAKNPRERIEAIIRASFSPRQFREESVAAWLNFYVQAQKSDDALRLLNVYQKRLRSNLMHDFKQLAGADARTLTRGLAAMIDGLYIRQALRRDPIAPAAAIDVLMHYLDTSLDKAALA